MDVTVTGIATMIVVDVVANATMIEVVIGVDVVANAIAVVVDVDVVANAAIRLRPRPPHQPRLLHPRLPQPPLPNRPRIRPAKFEFTGNQDYFKDSPDRANQLKIVLTGPTVLFGPNYVGLYQLV